LAVIAATVNGPGPTPPGSFLPSLGVEETTMNNFQQQIEAQDKLINDVLAYVGVRAGSLAEEIDRLEAILANLDRQIQCRIGRLERALPATALNGTGEVLVIEGNGLR
jgi:hypothetical protein